MAVTYSPNLRLMNISTGTETGVWGTLTNTNIGQLIEQAIAGQKTIALTNNTLPYTLTAIDGAVDEARSMALLFTGTMTVNKQIVIPNVPKMYVVLNKTTLGTSSYLEIATAGSGGVGTSRARVSQGKYDIVWCDGENSSYSLVNTSLTNYLPLTGGVLQAALAASTTLTIRGLTGQTGQLQSWADAAGTPMLWIEQDGDITSSRNIAAQAISAATISVAGNAVFQSDAWVEDNLLVGTTGNYKFTTDATYNLQYFEANYFWRFNRTTGSLQWLAPGGTYYNFNANGILDTSNYVHAGAAILGGSEGAITGGTAINLVEAHPGGYASALTQYAAFLPASYAAMGWNIGSGGFFTMRDNGVGYANAGWQTASDGRLKSDIVTIQNALGKITNLVGSIFTRDDITAVNGTHPRFAGLIAEHVQAMLPEAVSVMGPPPENDPDGPPLLAVDAMGVLALVVEAIKEVKQRLEALEAG